MNNTLLLWLMKQEMNLQLQPKTQAILKFHRNELLLLLLDEDNDDDSIITDFEFYNSSSHLPGTFQKVRQKVRPKIHQKFRQKICQRFEMNTCCSSMKIMMMTLLSLILSSTTLPHIYLELYNHNTGQAPTSCRVELDAINRVRFLYKCRSLGHLSQLTIQGLCYVKCKAHCMTNGS